VPRVQKLAVGQKQVVVVAAVVEDGHYSPSAP